MNPLNTTGLNAERARLDAQHATPPVDGTASGSGFADLLRGAREGLGSQAQVDQMPDRLTDKPASSADNSRLREARSTAAAAESRATEARGAEARARSGAAARTANEKAANEKTPNDKAATDQVASNSSGASGPKGPDGRQRGSMPSSPRSTVDAPNDAGTSDADAAKDPSAPGSTASVQPQDAASSQTASTLAHWLLGGGAHAAKGEAGLPPPQNTAEPSDDWDAAAMTRDLLQGLRSGGAAGAGGPEAAAGKAVAGGFKSHLEAKGVNGRGEGGAQAETAMLQAQGEPAAALPPVAGLGADASAHAGMAGMAASLAANGSPLGSAPDATTTVTVGAAVGTPEFEPAVVVTIAGLARDGVQEATLQLNPLEMGPVSVRIALEQGQARIDIGAAHADTRALFEATLPALAQALQDDGVQLASSQVHAWTPSGDASGAGQSPMDGGAGARGMDLSSGGFGGSGGSGSQPGGHADPSQATTTVLMPGAPGSGERVPGLPRGWGAMPGGAGNGGRGGLDLYA